MSELLEVLDPFNAENMLDEESIRARAEMAASDPTLHKDMARLSHFNNFEGLVYDTQTPDITNATLNYASFCCIEALMRDRKGRADIHIIGEVCRMIVEMLRVTKDWGISELGLFSEIAARKGAFVWSYEGLEGYSFPTIDGDVQKPISSLSSEEGFVDINTGRHLSWTRVMKHELIPKHPKLENIPPPTGLSNDKNRLIFDSISFYVVKDKVKS